MNIGRLRILLGVLAAGLFLQGAGGACAAEVDLTTATRITLPATGDQPETFKTPDGKEGWVRKLSNEQIPTPGYASGRIFTGNGMSQSVFRAIDALTGQTLWQVSTTDNGPTSPVITGGVVSYNTESCDTETRDLDNGSLVWKEVTGGSLLTQPVVCGDMLIVPHPTMARTAKMSDDSFRMLGVDLKTGKHFWDRNMTADVLGAPVSAGGNVYFTCADGRLFCMATQGGGVDWHVAARALSAPVVVGKTVAVSVQAKTAGGANAVAIRRFDAQDGTPIDADGIAATEISGAFPALGQQSGWDYQGPKIVAAGHHLFDAAGRTIDSVDVDTGKLAWRATVTGAEMSLNSFTPPAVGKSNLYLGSSRGCVFSVRQADGRLGFAYDIGQPLASPPILAEGNLYIGTANGYLVCLKLQDPDAKDWHQWGGDAQHNKVN